MERPASDPAIRSRLLLLGADPERADRLLPLISRRARVELRFVKTGLDLLDQYVSRRTAAIVVDTEAAGSDTPQLVHIIRSVDRECRIILLLSESNIATFGELKDLHGVSYLIKPVSDELLAHMVCASLGLKPESRSTGSSNSLSEGRRSGADAGDEAR